MSDQVDFLIAEYQELQANYRRLSDDTVWLQRYVFIFSGAVWAWIFASQDSVMKQAAIWAPLAVTCLFAMKAFVLHKLAGKIHEYTGEVEKRMQLDGLGWQNWMGTNKEKGFAKWLFGFWGVVALANGALGCYFSHLC